MSTDAPGSWLMANARIAPTAIRMRLTGIPTPGLCPSRVKEERPRNAGVVVAPAVAARGVFLQCTNRQPGLDGGCDDAAEPPRALVEVALAPVHQAVDA